MLSSLCVEGRQSWLGDFQDNVEQVYSNAHVQCENFGTKSIFDELQSDDQMGIGKKKHLISISMLSHITNFSLHYYYTETVGLDKVETVEIFDSKRNSWNSEIRKLGEVLTPFGILFHLSMQKEDSSDDVDQRVQNESTKVDVKNPGISILSEYDTDSSSGEYEPDDMDNNLVNMDLSTGISAFTMLGDYVSSDDEGKVCQEPVSSIRHEHISNLHSAILGLRLRSYAMLADYASSDDEEKVCHSSLNSKIKNCDHLQILSMIATRTNIK